MASTLTRPVWIRAAQSRWTGDLRAVWASELYRYSHAHAMTKAELCRFAAIQRWICEHANAMLPALRAEVLKCAAEDAHDEVCRGAALFEQRVDWENSAACCAAPLYGSCAQGTAERGGDADFAIAFRSRRQASNDADAEIGNAASSYEEPPRFLQRSIVLPVFFRQAGSTFPAGVDGLTTLAGGPQRLHVDRILHARVPVLKMVASRSILPKWDVPHGAAPSSSAPANGGSGSGSSDAPIPSFDVACCSSGCLNSALLRRYFEAFPPLRVLVLALKRWSRTRRLVHARKGWLTPYSLTIMAVFWAQERGHVPVFTSASAPGGATAWSLDAPSPLLDAAQCFLAHEDDSVEAAVERDLSLPPDACISALLLDFFVFYAHDFDRDVSVVDIRSERSGGGGGDGGAEGAGGRVRTRSEWKEQVLSQLAEGSLQVFGIETVRRAGSAAAAMLASNPCTRGSVAESSSLSSSAELDASKIEQVTRHLFGHDVVAVRDPVEPHSVCRSLDFFRAEAVWEEMRMACECSDPLQLLQLAQ